MITYSLIHRDVILKCRTKDNAMRTYNSKKKRYPLKSSYIVILVACYVKKSVFFSNGVHRYLDIIDYDWSKNGN